MSFEQNETGDDAVAIKGTTDGTRGAGILGEAGDSGGTGHAVGVSGVATGAQGIGLKGEGEALGLFAFGHLWHGVHGQSTSTIGGNGVYGFSEVGTGVAGESQTAYNAGVYGNHKGSSGWGVRGSADNGVGVSGASKQSYGVIGETGVPDMGEQIYDGRTAGVYGVHWAGGAGVFGHTNDANSIAVLGRGPLAGRFEGAVQIEGFLSVTQFVTIKSNLSVESNVSADGDVSGNFPTPSGPRSASLGSLWIDVQAIKQKLGL